MLLLLKGEFLLLSSLFYQIQRHGGIFWAILLSILLLWVYFSSCFCNLSVPFSYWLCWLLLILCLAYYSCLLCHCIPFFILLLFSISTSFLVGSLQDFLPRKRWELFWRLVGVRIQRTCLFSSGFSLFFLGTQFSSCYLPVFVYNFSSTDCKFVAVSTAKSLHSPTVLSDGSLCFHMFEIWICALF